MIKKLFAVCSVFAVLLAVCTLSSPPCSAASVSARLPDNAARLSVTAAWSDGVALSGITNSSGVINATTGQGSVLQVQMSNGKCYAWLCSDGSARLITGAENLLGVSGCAAASDGSGALRFTATLAADARRSGIDGMRVLRFGVLRGFSAFGDGITVNGGYEANTVCYDSAGRICNLLREADGKLCFADTFSAASPDAEYLLRAYCVIGDGTAEYTLYGETCRYMSRNVMQSAANDASSGLSGAEQTLLSRLAADNSGGAVSVISGLNTGGENGDHANDTNAASIELDYRSYYELSSATTGQTRYDNAYYPRMKSLGNGKYIMFWEYGSLGQHVYYALGNALDDWAAPKVLLRSADYKFTCDYGEGTDILYWATPDADVLQNGDILVAVSFRARNGYKTQVALNGIAVMRSTNGGKTFSNPQTVYVGTNWEPHVLQLSNGEIHIYFSHTAPKIAMYGFDDNYRSSGVGLIVSKDNGKTWEPDVRTYPYAATRVMQQYVMTVNGVKYMNDQMPVCCELASGRLALTAEARLSNGSYSISVARSDSVGAWRELGIDEAGPADRTTNFVADAAGPYLTRFLSGETLLSYNKNLNMLISLGNAEAKKFDAPISVPQFLGDGYWNMTESTGSHSAVAVSPRALSVGNAKQNSIRLISIYLNHTVAAENMKPALDGRSGEWNTTDGALFVGSISQAQLTVRTACDGKYLYLLCERLDDKQSGGDSAELLLGVGSKQYKLTFSGGKLSTSSNLSGAATGFCGRVLPGEGEIYEAAVPLDALGISGGAKLKLFITLRDNDRIGITPDTMTGASASDMSSWITVTLP